MFNIFIVTSWYRIINLYYNWPNFFTTNLYHQEVIAVQDCSISTQCLFVSFSTSSNLSELHFTEESICSRLNVFYILSVLNFCFFFTWIPDRLILIIITHYVLRIFYFLLQNFQVNSSWNYWSEIQNPPNLYVILNCECWIRRQR